MVAFLHLSDIHLKDNSNENPILKRTKIIVDRIKNRIAHCSDLVIIVSGDIAYSGKLEEYKIAKSFFDDLIKKIIKESDAWVRVLFVPGNHDCEFTPNAVRDALLRQAEAGSLSFDENVIEVLTSTQKNYLDFVNSMSFYRRKIKSIYRNKLYNRFQIKTAKYTLEFHCFNSATFSSLREKPGNLSFPLSNYYDELKDNNSISISVLHHPLNWMNSESHKELRNKLIEISDLVFTGHEHIPDDFTIQRRGDSAKFIESGALQDNYDFNNSSFGLLIINDQSENVISNLYNYKFESDSYLETDVKQFDIAKLTVQRNIVEITSDFMDWILEIGAPIIHPRKEDPILRDLYVSPDVQVIINPNDETADRTIRKDHNIEDLVIEKYCIVIGAESSGKTTFLKQVFQSKFQEDLFPILLDGSVIKKGDYTYLFENQLRKAFAKQYSVKDDEFYDKIDRQKIIILIDNYGACPLTQLDRNHLVDNIMKYFGGLFITAREFIHFDPISTTNSFEEFTFRKILELNHDKRKQIIRNWHYLGQPMTPDLEEHLSIKIRNSVRFVNSVLEKNFSEPYPIYIITLLQVQDANSKTLDHGSIGFYYEYLIKHSLQESVRDKNQISLYDTFLKEFCYFLFDERLNNIHEDDFREYIQNFEKRKRVYIKPSDLKEDLTRAKILRVYKEQVYIHQPYIYYYYASRAIGDNLQDKKVQKRVINMIDRIYIQEFEGIILFLSHLSSDNFVLSVLTKKCKSYFKDEKEATIDKDVVALDQLVEDEYLPLLESNDAPKAISKKDRPETSDPSKSGLELDPDVTVEVVSMLNKFVRSIKTFELMGNIAKINYSWDYEKKMPLIQDTYNLGLRVLSAYYSVIEGGARDIVSYVKEISNDREINTIPEQKSFTKKFAYQMTYLATYNIIKRLSDSLGHKQLRPIFQEISQNSPSNATKLIEFGVELVQLGVYNESKIKKSLSDNGLNRPIARQILRNLVYEYAQLFKLDIRTRQKIHSDANINIQNQRRIQQTSKRMKKK